MALKFQHVIFFQVLLKCLIIFGSPLSSPSLTSSSTVSLTESSGTSGCEPVQFSPCKKLYTLTQMPNLYGDKSSQEAEERMKEHLSNFSKCSSNIIIFFCTLYLPPCCDNKIKMDLSVMMHLPCRPMCEMVSEEARGVLGNHFHKWPITCQTLPTEDCFHFYGSNNITLVQTSINAMPSRTLQNDIASFAPLDVELGNGEGYEVEVVSMTGNQFPERRYDITDLGDSNMYQGWADVQATGAANDYCRVLGKGGRRFLSCNLAGSMGQGHHYVSKLGFEAGHPNTWFMRDMDGDGRDDYCRCVGTKTLSKITCMKAGENGFYGSTVQGGNQHTFTLHGSDGCYNKRLNPMFGESS